MTKSEFLELLKDDLSNEITHMHFYLYYASNIVGLHRHEYKEIFLKEAASEMSHVTEFSDFIIGMGGKSHMKPKEFDTNLIKLFNIIEAAKKMEEEVVDNYATRIHQAHQISDMTLAEKQWVEIFLESQIEHSRADVDEYKQILAGLCNHT